MIRVASAGKALHKSPSSHRSQRRPMLLARAVVKEEATIVFGFDKMGNFALLSEPEAWEAMATGADTSSAGNGSSSASSAAGADAEAEAPAAPAEVVQPTQGVERETGAEQEPEVPPTTAEVVLPSVGVAEEKSAKERAAEAHAWVVAWRKRQPPGEWPVAARSAEEGVEHVEAHAVAGAAAQMVGAAAARAWIAAWREKSSVPA